MTGAAKHGMGRVVKLGGSLLNWPDFPDRFRKWLARQPVKPTGLIVGGGAFVDLLRTADRIHLLGETASHELAIQCMSLTAELVAQRMVEWKPISSDLLQSGGEPTFRLDVRDWMKRDKCGSSNPLPATWQVTSDSIAARICDLLEWEELVLLKSAFPPAGSSTLAELATAGYVDAFFPQAANRLDQVRLINLRDDQFAEARFRF